MTGRGQAKDGDRHVTLLSLGHADVPAGRDECDRARGDRATFLTSVRVPGDRRPPIAGRCAAPQAPSWSWVLVAGGTAQGAVGAGPAVRSEPVRGATGLGDAYFPLDGNGGIDVLRYRIHDAYRFDDQHLRGRTRITVRATEDLSAFDLDFLLARAVGSPWTAGRPGHASP